MRKEARDFPERESDSFLGYGDWKDESTFHIMKEYATGVGHIDALDGGFLVTFYGMRTQQAEVATLQEARFSVRAFAKSWEDWSTWPHANYWQAGSR